MDMIGHQAPGVNLYAVDVLEVGQGLGLALEVTGLDENHLPVMPTLDDVVGVIRQDGSSNPGHGDPPVNSMHYDERLHLQPWKINLSPFS